MCAGPVFAGSMAKGNTARDSLKKALPFTGGVGAVVGNNMKSTGKIKREREGEENRRRLQSAQGATFQQGAFQ